MDYSFRAINDTTLGELTLAGNRLPTPVWDCFRLLNWCHQYLWYAKQKKDIYLNPNNFVHLVVGFTINATVGNRRVVRIAAHIVFITQTILDSIDQCFRLEKACIQLKNAFLGRYPTHYYHHWHTDPSMVSSSTRNRCTRFAQNVADYFITLAHAVALVAMEMFLLLMKTMTVMRAFQYGANRENVVESFVNINRSVTLLESNQTHLLEKIKTHRDLIQRILKGVGSKLQVEDLEKTIEKQTKVFRKVDKVVKAIGPALVNLGQHAITGFMVSIGELESMPPQFLPPNEDL